MIKLDTTKMIRFEDLIDKVRTSNPDADTELLRRAYVFSAYEHKGQVRRSGEPYLVHPLEVADLLADQRLDVVAVAAAAVVVVMAAPLLRVVWLIAAWWRSADWRFVGTGCALLALVVFVMVKLVNNARRRFEAEPPPKAAAAPPEDVLLLREIRDALKK